MTENIKPSDIDSMIDNNDLDFRHGRKYKLKIDLPYRTLKYIIECFNNNEPDDEDVDLIKLLSNHFNIINNELWISFKKGTIFESVGYNFDTPEFKIENVYIKISNYYPLKFEKYSDVFEEI